MLLLLALVSLVAPVPALALDCTDATWDDCCLTSASYTSGCFYCNGSNQVCGANPVLTATEIDHGLVEDLDCRLTFEYSWSPFCTESSRTIRICWAACAGNDGPDCTGSCQFFCEDVAVGGASPVNIDEEFQFVNPNSGFDACYYCRAIVIDVSDNTSCNPPSSTPCNLGSLGPCSTNCGTPIIEARSTCAMLDD